METTIELKKVDYKILDNKLCDCLAILEDICLDGRYTAAERAAIMSIQGKLYSTINKISKKVDEDFYCDDMDSLYYRS